MATAVHSGGLEKDGGGVGGADTQRHSAPEATRPHDAARRWGIVLAGGDGVRLRSLTRFVSGDARPKQFCRLLSGRTLLEETRERAERSLPPDRILYSVTRAHQEYYARDLAGQALQRVVQPCNKGTAPAILYTLLHIAQLDPGALVAVLPSDHHYARERAFTGALDFAFTIAGERPESVVLLGAQPANPEVEYGWIEVGGLVSGFSPGVFHVSGFHEKPERSVAERLFRRACLWNTFVMIGHVNAFLEMAAATVPALLDALRSVPVFPISDLDKDAAGRLYAEIDPADFSRRVLTPAPSRLLTLRLCDAGWSDLGDPDRVVSILLERDDPPGWALRWQSERRAGRDIAAAASIALA